MQASGRTMSLPLDIQDMNSREDDMPPTGDEACAQRQETIMPLIWAGLGLLVIVGFCIWSMVH